MKSIEIKGLIRETTGKTSTNSVRKELNNLSSAGYLKKHSENNKVIYKANASHPLFKIIQIII